MSDDFATIMTSLDAPMVIVTTAFGQERAGCLVGFHAQSSIDPPRYAVWLSKANHTYRIAFQSPLLAVHFLTEDDRELAVHFGTLTGDDVDKFAGIAVSSGEGGLPLLDACPNRLVMRRIALLDEGGDHVCVTAEPVSAEAARPFTPLRLSAVADLEPGHAADDRPEDPPP